LCPDNAIRRNLARQAADAGWSVRELESRARSAVSPHLEVAKERAAKGGGADQQAAIEQIADALGAALGADVRVKSTAGGFAVQLSVASVDEALALAGRIAPGPRQVARQPTR
jgi:ParB family chromosome partitioning protein